MKSMRQGDLKVADYVEMLIGKIRAKSDMNAFISFDEDPLRTQAKARALHRENGGDCGPLFNLPIATSL